MQQVQFAEFKSKSFEEEPQCPRSRLRRGFAVYGSRFRRRRKTLGAEAENGSDGCQPLRAFDVDGIKPSTTCRLGTEASTSSPTALPPAVKRQIPGGVQLSPVRVSCKMKGEVEWAKGGGVAGTEALGEQSHSSLESGSTEQEGWLDLQRPTRSKFWVRFDGKFMSCFKSDKDAYSEYVISVSSMELVRSRKEKRFILSTCSTEFVFKAETTGLRAEWLRALELGIKQHRDQHSSVAAASPSPPQWLGGQGHRGKLALRGFLSKVYTVIANDKLWLFRNEQDYRDGIGITNIHMNLASVKDSSGSTFHLVTPSRSFSFKGSSEQECSAWTAALEQSISHSLSSYEVAARVWEVVGNDQCADCQAERPEWASINLLVVICTRCAGQHRALGPIISKVRSLKMDSNIWTEPVIQLFEVIGNRGANQIWAGNVPPGEQIGPDSSSEQRQTFITAKYQLGKYQRLHPLTHQPHQLHQTLCRAVLTADIAEMVLLVFSGACVTAHSDTEPLTALQLAERVGNTTQLEFLRQNQHRVAAPVGSLDRGKPSTAPRYYLCALEANVLKFFSYESSETPCDSICLEQLLSLTRCDPGPQPGEDRGNVRLELLTTTGENYVIDGASSDCLQEWASCLARNVLPEAVPEGETGDFQLLGRLKVREAAVRRWSPAWALLTPHHLLLYLDNSSHEQLSLHSITELIHFTAGYVIAAAGTRLWYLKTHLLSNFEGWCTALSVAVSTAREQHTGDAEAPMLVTQCIRYITEHGMTSEGIYLGSGHRSKVIEVWELFQEPRVKVSAELGAGPELGVSEVAGALKKYFRELEENLFTVSSCGEWLSVSAVEDEEEKLGLYGELIENLPQRNRATLRALIDHLHCVQYFSSSNGMSADALSRVFGPILFQMDGTAGTSVRVVQDLLHNYITIFKVDVQELEERLEQMRESYLEE
ncbi:arf-GAP with Rho-GAP domain, ANK repeat and PH domain-containing protein 1 isoform X2 [Callorhinchus milii]|uniref:arf-GAP with Rho-GAP domain, ANK repeat and PH domain-containing protein 1 isoform X2 n=1 Tax=Callorhinchus milii TaxID=7868 RepID=UPI001C3FEA4D|nr:arf-GAP with Rho-GAP domain, ANK repeat and PH domain-containing protein 1 isoform X2 [Callorhinchus milii]